jgi:hypothetical protein
MFNDKVRIMNQTRQRDLVLSAVDARNLHAEIFALLAQISEISRQTAPTETVSPIQIGMDGGGFK